MNSIAAVSLPQCVICLEVFHNWNSLVLLDCSHVYHSRCFQRWSVECEAARPRRKESCPLCSKFCTTRKNIFFSLSLNEEDKLVNRSAAALMFAEKDSMISYLKAKEQKLSEELCSIESQKSKLRNENLRLQEDLGAIKNFVGGKDALGDGDKNVEVLDTASNKSEVSIQELGSAKAKLNACQRELVGKIIDIGNGNWENGKIILTLDEDYGEEKDSLTRGLKDVLKQLQDAKDSKERILKLEIELVQVQKNLRLFQEGLEKQEKDLQEATTIKQRQQQQIENLKHQLITKEKQYEETFEVLHQDLTESKLEIDKHEKVNRDHLSIKKEFDHVTQELGQVRAENDLLSNENSRLLRMNNNLKASGQTMTEELCRIESKKIRLEADMLSLNKARKTLETEIRGRDDKIVTLARQIAELQKQDQDSFKRNEMQQERIEALAAESEQLIKQLEEQRTDLLKKNKMQQERIEALSAECEKLIKQLQEQRTDLLNENKMQQERIEALSAESETLIQQLQEQRKDLTKMRQILTENEERNELKTEKLKQQIKSLIEQSKDSNLQTVNLGNRVSQQKKELADLKTRRKKEVAESQEKLEQHLLQEKDFKNKLMNIKTQLDLKKKELEAIQKCLGSQKSMTSELTEKNKTQEEEIEKHKNESKKDEVEKCEDEVKNYQDEVKNYQAEIKNYQDEIKNYQDEVKNCQDEIKKLEEEVKRGKVENSKETYQLQHLQKLRKCREDVLLLCDFIIDCVPAEDFYPVPLSFAECHDSLDCHTCLDCHNCHVQDDEKDK